MAFRKDLNGIGKARCERTDRNKVIGFANDPFRVFLFPFEHVAKIAALFRMVIADQTSLPAIHIAGNEIRSDQLAV
jgi:hypothetical protein